MQILTYGVIISFVLMLAALSGMFSEKSGVVNIAINGMMLGGALIYWLFQQKVDATSTGMQIVGYFVSSLGGILIGLIFGFAAITLKADQVIAGTALNLLFSALGLFMYQYMGGDSASIIDGEYGSLASSRESILYIFGIIMIIALSVFLIAYIWIQKTPWGLRLKAAGENPQALDSQGISVNKTRYYGVMISGALAALAGAIFIKTSALFDGNVSGLGFVALAVMIAGQWNPGIIFATSMIFGMLYSTGINLTVYKQNLSNIKPLLQALPFILSLVALMATSKNSRAPKSAGIAYDKSKR